MKKNKIYYILIAAFLFISLFIAPYNVMSIGDKTCCYTQYWTKTVELQMGTYYCCYSGNECTPCVIAE